MLIGGFALLSVPLSFVHYYYTLERVTLENLAASKAVELDEKAIDFSSENRKNLFKQIKCLCSSKYWVLAFLYTTLATIVYSLSGYNLNTNFCNVILGATAENNYNLIYTIASGLPMGLGVLIVYPLAKKYTVRNTTIAFSALSIIGCVMGLIVKSNFWPVVAANFMFNTGTLPTVYIIGALINSANDDVEYRFGFRPEGTIASAVMFSLMGLVTGAFAGVYETGLSAFGYDVALGVNQPEAVVNWIYFVRYGVQIIQYVLIIAIMYFMDLEKKLPAMQEEIRRRHKQEASL